MDFVGAIKSGFKNYANFKGVAGRAEYWYWFLFNFLTGMVVFVLDLILNLTILESVSAFPMPGILYLLWILASFLPTLAMQVRRVRDAGQSWVWILVQNVLMLIVFVCLVAFVVTMLTSGQNIDYMSDDDEYISAQVEILLNNHPELIGLVLLGLFSYFVAAALSMVLLVFTLLPTKTFDQGNRYLKPQAFENKTE